MDLYFSPWRELCDGVMHALGIDLKTINRDESVTGGKARQFKEGRIREWVALPNEGQEALILFLEMAYVGSESETYVVPVTYVPARNTIFLAYALAWAEVLGAWDIFIGVNAVDYSGYPDCRPEYIQAFETMANLATKAAVEGRGRLRIHTPLIHTPR